MFTGLHAILYSKDAERLRSFFRDVLEWKHVDAGRGWLIFAAPPAELAMHPTEGEGGAELYLMCDDLDATIRQLKTKGVECGAVSNQGWGLLTHLKLPDGGKLGLYEPRHPTAISGSTGSSGSALPADRHE